MKKREKKSQGVVKGTGRAFVLSVLVHLGLFLLAGTLVIFTVVYREEKKFEPPPPAQQPKIKLKKPKVRMKKSSQPKARSRITTKSRKSAMPVIELPEMGGIGEGLGEGITGFDIMPDFEEVTVFGAGQTIGSDFVGTFYDMKRTRNGSFFGVGLDEFRRIVGRFVRSGFDKSTLARFYRSPKKLYATCFMVPTMRSAVAPKAFGENDTGGWCWMVHYAGKLVYPEEITFRFRGSADDILVVQVAGRVVLNASRNSSLDIVSDYRSSHAENRAHQMGNTGAIVGEWITLEPGVPQDMDVVGGEAPGGEFDMMLAVEVKGEDYPQSSVGAPIFPMFKTAEPGHDLRDAIYEWLVEEEVSVTNGPVFSDVVPIVIAAETATEEQQPLPSHEEDDGLRTWSVGGDHTIEADFVSCIGNKIALKTHEGAVIKIPLDQLSSEDREFVELSNPPMLNITFIKRSGQRMIQTSPHLTEVPPRIFDWKFGAKMQQTSANPYAHELTAEYFAVGQQFLDDSKYILLDRDSASFVLNKENHRSFEFEGDRTVETMNYVLKSWERGYKYKGYLVLIRDKRGRIIQHHTSNDWLYENRENLMELPMGSFFDKSCQRVHPSGPKRWY